MIHMNMQLTLKVLRIVFSITGRVIRPLTSAAMVAAVAPTAELSVRLVNPIRNNPVMQKKIKNGMMPALGDRQGARTP